MVISTERWDRHRDAQHATDRLTIKNLTNDALSVCELRAGVSARHVDIMVAGNETCIVTRNMGLRMTRLGAYRV
jgi:hypothetical protein